jgi:hypothetical protein
MKVTVMALAMMSPTPSLFRYQHVISTRLLKIHPHGAMQKTVFANDHGIHQAGIGGVPESVDPLDNLAMHAGAPEFG